MISIRPNIFSEKSKNYRNISVITSKSIWSFLLETFHISYAQENMIVNNRSNKSNFTFSAPIWSFSSVSPFVNFNLFNEYKLEWTKRNFMSTFTRNILKYFWLIMQSHFLGNENQTNPYSFLESFLSFGRKIKAVRSFHLEFHNFGMNS